MKRVLFTIIALAILSVMLTAGVMDDNGRAGVTGAPGETTCNQTNCHNSYTINTGPGSISASSTMNNWSYVPGSTYSISITVRKPSGPIFGFGTEILQPNGNNAGTIMVTNPTRTSIKTRLVGSYYRRTIVHTLNGGLTPDSCVFTFNWVAPTTNIGNVTLYAAGNAANHNDSATGDYIYTMNHVIVPDNGVGITDLLQGSNSFKLYPLPARDFVTLSFDNPDAGNLTVVLSDLTGKKIEEIYSGFSPAGIFEEQLSLPSVKSGIYLLTVTSAEGSRSRRITIL
jgi:hypothetical protein